MIIVMKKEATKQEIQHVSDEIAKHGMKVYISKGVERTVIGALGYRPEIPLDHFEVLSGVEEVMRISKPFKLASREFHPKNTVVKIRDVEIGGNDIAVIAGPCAVESEKLLLETAKAVQKTGVKILRGSAYKPRTSPYDFQGMEEEGLKILKDVGAQTGMIVETEVMDTRDVGLVADYVDMLRIGARNMQNFDLLKEVGRCGKPVILKKGLSSTIKEFLMAAEYILSEGNQDVILCERGMRTFETETRFTLDLSAIPVVKQLSHLPIVVDPSHAAGKSALVGPLSKAAVAIGADGLIIEVHPNPEKALSDGPQQLLPKQFAELMAELKPIAHAIGRKI